MLHKILTQVEQSIEKIDLDLWFYNYPCGQETHSYFLTFLEIIFLQAQYGNM